MEQRRRAAQAADGLNVIHEDIGEYPQFRTAQKWLREAAEVYFLGFGYHPTNLRRLGLSTRTNSDGLYGTACAVEDGELRMIDAFLDPIVIQKGSDMEHVNTFLRKRWVTKLVAR